MRPPPIFHPPSAREFAGGPRTQNPPLENPPAPPRQVRGRHAHSPRREIPPRSFTARRPRRTQREPCVCSGVRLALYIAIAGRLHAERPKNSLLQMPRQIAARRFLENLSSQNIIRVAVLPARAGIE